MATSPSPPDRDPSDARASWRARGGGKAEEREAEALTDPLLDRSSSRRDRNAWRRSRRAQVLASLRGGGPLRSPIARMMLAIVVVLFLLLAVSLARAAVGSDGFVAVPPYSARVTDQIGMLTTQQRSALEGVLADYEARSGSQIAVLLVSSTAPEAIEQYSIRVAEAWKLGRKGIADGVLLLVAKDNPSSLRRLRIESGRGVQGSLTDAQSKRVLQDVIAPHFRQSDWYGGLVAGVSAIQTLIDKEHLPAPAGAANRAGAPAGASSGAPSTAGAADVDATPGASGTAGLGRMADAAGAGAIGGATPPPRAAAGSNEAPRASRNHASPAQSGGGGFGWLVPLVIIGAGFFLLRGRGRSSSLGRGGWGSNASGVLIGAALGNALGNAGRSWGQGGGGFGGGGFGGGGGGFSGGGGGTFDGGGASGDW